VQSSQEIIKKHYSNYSNYSKNKLNNYSTIVSKVNLTRTEADRVMDSVADLIDNPSYRPFFFKRLYTIGPSKFLDAANKARQGNRPGGCFVYWLRQV
jgi:hypothetical protein